MYTWLPLFALMLAWISLPLALRPLMGRAGLPATSMALATIAGLICIAVALKGIEPPLVISTAANGDVYHDTYYIVSTPWLELGPFILLGVGGLAVVVQGFVPNGRLAQSTITGHWAFHLGAGLVIAQVLPLIPMPHRYIDYSEVFFWRNMVANAGNVLCFGGAILIAAGFLVSLARLILRR